MNGGMMIAMAFVSVVRSAMGPLGMICCAILLLVCLFSGSAYSWQEDYEFVLEWGTAGSDTGQIAGPLGMDIDGDGYIYICENGNKRVQKFDTLGNSLLVFGEYGTAPGQFLCPWDVAVGDSGFIYVSDPCNRRIQKFDSLGAFVLAWGDTGSAPGEFDWCQGIDIDADGQVYVADVLNLRIQKFDRDGQFLLQWHLPPDSANFAPTALGLADDRVYTYSYSQLSNFICLDLSGSFILEFGSWGFAPGQFQIAEDIASDTAGCVYATDSWGYRVQKFDRNGRFVSLWGSSGTGPGQFLNPFGIVVDKNGSVYVSDANRNRILKFKKRD